MVSYTNKYDKTNQIEFDNQSLLIEKPLNHVFPSKGDKIMRFFNMFV